MNTVCGVVLCPTMIFSTVPSTVVTVSTRSSPLSLVISTEITGVEACFWVKMYVACLFAVSFNLPTGNLVSILPYWEINGYSRAALVARY